MRLFATHLRQETNMESYDAAGRSLAPINTSSWSTILPPSSSTTLPSKICCGLMMVFLAPSGTSSSKIARAQSYVAPRPNDKLKIPEIIKTMTKKSRAVPKRSLDSCMRSRVQGGEYKSSSWALSGFYSLSSHSLCTFPKTLMRVSMFASPSRKATNQVACLAVFFKMLITAQEWLPAFFNIHQRC